MTIRLYMTIFSKDHKLIKFFAKVKQIKRIFVFYL